MSTKNVIDDARIGTKGFPKHYAAFGLEPPLKEVTVDDPKDPGTAPELPPTTGDLSRAVQRHLDEVVRQRQYDSIETAVSYRGDPNPVFSADGKAAFAWRSAVWSHAVAEFGKIESGKRRQPAIPDFIAELPKIAWPDGAG